MRLFCTSRSFTCSVLPRPYIGLVCLSVVPSTNYIFLRFCRIEFALALSGRFPLCFYHILAPIMLVLFVSISSPFYHFTQPFSLFLLCFYHVLAPIILVSFSFYFFSFLSLHPVVLPSRYFFVHNIPLDVSAHSSIGWFKVPLLILTCFYKKQNNCTNTQFLKWFSVRFMFANTDTIKEFPKLQLFKSFYREQGISKFSDKIPLDDKTTR